MTDPQFIYTATNPFGLKGFDPALVDIDGDGDLDAFAAGQFFRNTGTASNPIFAAPSNNLFGLSGASPDFVDIDDDGDLDAFVGGGDIRFFKNTGTASNPAFSAPVTSPFGMTVDYEPEHELNYVPVFVDIDGDGDLDAFVGKYDGATLFFQNTGTVNNAAFAAYITNPFGLGYTVRYAHSPSFVDIDGDGDLDLFLGFFYGNKVSFFRNTGTASNPMFASDIASLLDLDGVGYGGNPTFADIDDDGDLDAFVGNYSGNIRFYTNDSSGLLLVSTSGNDILTGTSSANDTVSYVTADAAVTVLLATTTQQDTLGAGLDTLTNIENLIGSNFDDKLTGNNKNNILNGGAGNDELRGWSGEDDLIGGRGDDIYFVDNAGDVIIENSDEGQDKIYTSVGYTLPSNVENLTLGGTLAINGVGNRLANKLLGNTAANRLDGGDGDDILDGKAGADQMYGGSGNDHFVVDNPGDIVDGDYGIDKVSSSITYTLPNGVENLRLTGALAINGAGNGFANKIIGNSANNRLNGGFGNDVLDGRGGNNVLTGGANQDIFRFTTLDHVDTITDFVVVDDTIQLENSIFTVLTTIGTLAADQFRIGTKAVDANDFIVYNSTAGNLLYDADGNGAVAAIPIASIGVGLSLTNADIMVN